MEKLKLLLIAFLLSFSFTTWAQEGVSGVVTDGQNNIIPGTSTIITNTNDDFEGDLYF